MMKSVIASTADIGVIPPLFTARTQSYEHIDEKCYYGILEIKMGQQRYHWSIN